MFLAASDALPFTISGTVSGPVLIGLIALISAVIGLWRDIRSTKREMRNSVGTDPDTLKDLIERTVKNTQPVSNGFAKQVLAQLDSIDRRTARTEDSVHSHLEWHMNQRKEGK